MLGSCDGSDFNHGYDDKSYYYYNVHSDYYDTDFAVICKKQLFSASCFGINFASEEIYDNLNKAINDKRILNMINSEMSLYNPTISSIYIPAYKTCDLKIDVEFNDNFNMQYYNMLLSFKNKLNTETRNNQGSNFTINYVFNNVSLSSFGNNIYFTTKENKSISIDNKDFWNYIGQ